MPEDNMIESEPIFYVGQEGPASDVQGQKVYEQFTSTKDTRRASDLKSYEDLLRKSNVPQEDIARQVSLLAEIRGLPAKVSSAIGQAFSHEHPQKQPVEVERDH